MNTNTSPASVLRSGERFSVVIEKLALGGQGIARIDGKTVFVRGGLPGDRAQIRLTRLKPNYVEADLVAVEQPSPDRIAPRCAHFTFCGGCSLQNLDYSAQIRWKQAQLAETLEHVGRIRQLPEISIVPMEEPWHYRNKMEFSFGREGDRVVVGLHQRNSFQRVVKIDHCWIAPELASTILQEVEAFANRSGLPAYDPKHHQGFWRYMVVRVARSTNKALVMVVTQEGSRDLMMELARHLTERIPQIAHILWGVSTRVSDVAHPETTHLLAGSELLEDQVGPLTVQMKPMNFLQPNLTQAELLYQEAFSTVDLKNHETVYDLYCGIGVIGLRFASRVKQVIGIESDPDNVVLAQSNARRNRVENASFVCGKVEDLLTKRGLLRLGPAPDLLVIDPPRAGIHPDAIAPLLQAQSKRILYISCNPASLARDLQVIFEREPRYQLSRLKLFDFFPHTSHLETLVDLTLV